MASAQCTSFQQHLTAPQIRCHLTVQQSHPPATAIGLQQPARTVNLPEVDVYAEQAAAAMPGSNVVERASKPASDVQDIFAFADTAGLEDVLRQCLGGVEGSLRGVVLDIGVFEIAPYMCRQSCSGGSDSTAPRPDATCPSSDSTRSSSVVM